MPPENSTLESYYAARAPEYDSVYLKPERQTDLRAIERWLPMHFVGADVLEVACGTGYWTQFIAPVASHVLAIDAARETISIAKERVPKNNIEFVLADAYALPISATKFDAAFCGFWFSHVPKERMHEFLHGLGSVVQQNSKVVLLDNRFVEGSSSPVSEQDAHGNMYQSRRLADGTTYRVLKNFPSQAELESVVAGFGRDVSFTEWEFYWACTYVSTSPQRTRFSAAR